MWEWKSGRVQIFKTPGQPGETEREQVRQVLAGLYIREGQFCGNLLRPLAMLEPVNKMGEGVEIRCRAGEDTQRVGKYRKAVGEVWP
jgi:hypothetical protein